MARDSHKHQRKLAKQKAKRQSRKREIARRQSVGLEGQLARASAAPILDCLVPADIWEQGIGQVLISRELPHQQVACAVFLVDVWCLGVKDAFASIAPKSEYKEGILAGLRDQFDMRSMPPEYIRKLVEEAVAYAAQFGLPPHADYQIAKAFFGAIDPTACDEHFEFGKDGNPFYVAGPYESTEKSQWIVRRLSQSAGQGNYDYVVPVSGKEVSGLGWMPGGDDDDDDDDEADEFDEGPPALPAPADDTPPRSGWLPRWFG